MITTRITFFLEVADLKIVLSVYNTYVIQRFYFWSDLLLAPAEKYTCKLTSANRKINQSNPLFGRIFVLTIFDTKRRNNTVSKENRINRINLRSSTNFQSNWFS